MKIKAFGGRQRRLTLADIVANNIILGQEVLSATLFKISQG